MKYRDTMAWLHILVKTSHKLKLRNYHISTLELAFTKTKTIVTYKDIFTNNKVEKYF